MGRITARVVHRASSQRETSTVRTGDGIVSQNFLEAASRAHGLGQLEHAEGLYRAVPAFAPEYADAVVGLAVVAYQRRRFGDAVVHFSRLVALRPGDGANHSNLGECLREAGRLDDAVVQLKLGLLIDPDQPDAWNSLGLVYHAQKKVNEAEQALRRALELRPAYPLAMINLGMVLLEKRGQKEAVELFRKALALEPDHPMGTSNLGQVLVEIGEHDDLDEAERLCLKAIRLTPDRPHPINNLGNVYRAMGRFEEALECYKRAMALAPTMAMPINNLGQALQGRARYAEAREHYLSALSLEPNSARIHANVASLHHDQEEYEEALARFRHALAIDPEHVESLCGMGRAYTRLMRTAEAEACFRKALELDPESTAPRMGLASLYAELGEFARADEEHDRALAICPKIIEVYYQRATHQNGKVTDADLAMMNSLLDQKYLGDGGRAQLNFALGAVHDKRKDHEAAGRHFQAANASQRAARLKRNETYEPESFATYIRKMIDATCRDLIERFEGEGHASDRPIFVVGLPRSGTTLTEQILASHPAVHGAGELELMSKTFQCLPSTLGLAEADSFEALQRLSSAGLVASGGAYLRELERRNAGSRFVVDKMPDNINLLGWIHLVFPNARVIHCRRDPRDIALSCWQTSFGAIRWANEWGHIAHRFDNYLRIVDHWKTLTSVRWLDFPYESLIANPEAQARALINYVGLDWDPNCLNFHETKRFVRTASQSQVREPIYKTSVAKWRNYEREMAPFLDEMMRLGHDFH
jgi:tetratricopeptide (TPR) repeat protein